MASVIDLTDKRITFPIAYNLQPVRGWMIKHYDTVLSNSSQRTVQHALGDGQWDGLDKLWIDAFELDSDDYVLHNNGANDTPDIFFPDEPPHPWTTYISAKLKSGISEDQTTKLFGIYRTLRTPNYNGAGQQLNSVGGIVSPADPRTEYFYKPNPANAAIDQLLRWGKKLPGIVNFPAWVDWRDYNDELISRDDAAYTPRGISLTPSASGSLTPGTTYYIRVATLKGADTSSASRQTIETAAHSITLTGGQTSFQVAWLIKGDEELPPAPQSGITGYRIYIGTVENVWLGYFEIATPASRTFTVTTTSGVIVGNPLDVATAGLLSQIKRFECGLFFVPPYDLAGALDKICQISCSDWQWSGLGTGTYRNDKVRFMSPAGRTPVFTLNLAETGMGSFRTFPIDRRTRPNQVVVDFRDRDDPYLDEGQPVILDREQLQDDEFGQIKTHHINGGTMYRSQAQRVASFYARTLCDMDQMAAMIGSPKTYHILPADVIYVTNDTPDWEDIEFVVRKKEENVETNLGDPLTLQLYSPDAYSDTDHSPLPRPLPTNPLNPFAVAPLVASVTLSQRSVTTADNTAYLIIEGQVVFSPFHQPQIGRVWWRRPDDEILFTADAGTNVITTSENHNYENGTAIMIRTPGTTPGGLLETTTYFVRDKTDSTFKVALTLDGAEVDITSNGSGSMHVAPFRLTNIFLDPVLPDLVANFSLGPVEEGTHKIKVVTESTLQQKLDFEQHVTHSITISFSGSGAPVLNAIAGSFDESNGALLIELDGTEYPKTPYLESYELEIRNLATPPTATLRSGIIIRPAFKNASITPPWELHPSSDLIQFGPNPYGIAFRDPGGVYMVFANEASSITGWVRTKIVGSPVGGLQFEAQLSPDDIASFRQPDTITLETDDGTQCFGWVRVSHDPILYSITSVPARTPDTDSISVALGDRLMIWVRDDGVVEFYINNLGDSSQPVAISGVQVDRTKLFRGHIRHTVSPGLTAKVNVIATRWNRQGPEWVYNPKAQAIDYGTTLPTLPTTIKVRARQLSPFEGGPASAWVDGVFTR